MRRPPPLTEAQRNRLAVLEPKLRDAARLGDYEKAKVIASDLQSLLRPTRHETRLMQAKNWLFESAMEAGDLQVAISGFQGVRAKMSPNTRVHLEATALLAICYLRRKQISEAEPLIAAVLRNDSIIKSEKRRRQFRASIIGRFEQEGVLAALVGTQPSRMNVDDLQADAGRMLRTMTEDELFATVGREVPPEVIMILLHIQDFARRQIPPVDRSLLAPVRTPEEKVAIGRTIMEAAKRVVWRSLCDPENEVYKAWCSNGMMAVIDKKLITGALVAMLSGMKIGAFALAAALAAIIFKMGLDVFCEVAKPAGVMLHVSEDRAT
jgi:hypothetical protein